MEMPLSQRITKLQKTIRTVGNNSTLDYLKPEFIEKMELEQKNHPVFSGVLGKIKTDLKKVEANYEDYNSIRQLATAYSEAYLYSKLFSILHIKKIQEQHHPTPDWEVIFNGKKFYIEQKCLHLFDGDLNYADNMEESLSIKAEMDLQLSPANPIAIGEQITHPYRKKGDDASYEIHKQVDRLIEKISQNIKREQYPNNAPSLLLVDLSETFPVNQNLDQTIKQTFTSRNGEYEFRESGLLWHIAFGEPDMKIFSSCTSGSLEEANNSLEKRGILLEYPFIQGLIFHVNDQFVSLAKLCEKTCDAVQLIRWISKKNYAVHPCPPHPNAPPVATIPAPLT